MKDYHKTYEEWLSNSIFDEETRAELKGIAGNEDEIRDRFYTDLEFGTAGLRGVIGAGLNRMNKYIVRRATQGLANYIIKLNGQSKGVAIAYDSRHMSIEFSREAALTLAANGIKAYRFESLRPTPELSFAVRKLGCIAGINITASHNPPEYNGYKVYWEDGAQFTPPHDKGVTAEVNAITDFAACLTMDEAEATAKGLYITIGKEIDDAYIAEVKSTLLDKEAIAKAAPEIKVVYTPLHGTGHVPVTRILSELGFTHVYEVPEQALPDGDFPTVSYPNPEDKAAFKLALDLAKEKDADLVLATDPDADRLGVYAKDSATGEYVMFTGNMSGSLLCEYVLARKAERGMLREDSFVVESIVSTDMIKAIAKNYGCELKEVLTGFKWIGREMLKAEETGKGKYEFGMEESYGCLVGTYARDKDAVSAVAMLCEAASHLKLEGKTLVDMMNEMYAHYGFYNETVDNVTLKGADGSSKITGIMKGLREARPSDIGGVKVERIRDYASGVTVNLADGSEEPAGLPATNAIYFELEDNGWVCVRPSGTEPKIKFYVGIKGSSAEEAKALGSKVVKDIRARFVDPAL